jgi:phosphate transport system substrate-binding protein
MPFTKTTHDPSRLSWDWANSRDVRNNHPSSEHAGVHKNDTSNKVATDTVALGVNVWRTYRIDPPIELFPARTLPSHSTPDRKGAETVRPHRTLIVSIAIALILAVPATATAKRLIIDGSTSMLPMTQKLATAYHKAFPKIQAPKVGGGQTAIGISDASSGRVDIGEASRDPIPGVDPKGLIFTKVARDGVCVITSPENPIENMSQQTVTGIFTGAIRDWSQVAGAHVSGPIDLFQRDGASGTQDAFQNIFLGENLKISPSATQETSEGLEANAVSPDPKAIGFVSVSAAVSVHTVGYQGVPCTLRNAKSGQYGGVRNFWMVTKGIPKGEALKFIAWVTKPGNKSVRAIINSGWIAIH